MKLLEQTCIPCRGGIPPLKGNELQPLLRELGNGWNVITDHHLERTFKFKNFLEALEFTNAVGRIAEQENHHPEITLTWGIVTVRIWTHKIDGLTESDFIMAAKIDQAPRPGFCRPPDVKPVAEVNHSPFTSKT